jgi:short-subunit dehydrogenase
MAESAAHVLVGRTEGKVEEAIKRMLSETATRVTGVAADLGSSTGVDQLLQKVGAVDILINNVGIFEPKPFLEIPDAAGSAFLKSMS